MASKATTNESRIFCKECNLHVPSNDYNGHVQGKKHKKSIWKRKSLARRNCETSPTKPDFVLQEPASLDMQFRVLLNQVILTQNECTFTTARILEDLEPCLTQEFVGCCPYIFGSMSTGLALVGSDVDIYLDTGIYGYLITLPDPKPEIQQLVNRCARTLRTDKRFSQIVPITQARVPIVKFVHNPTGLSCDISFKDPLGVQNSQLMRFYMLLNPRFFEVMVAIKFWAKKYGLCATDGISSYGWTLLFISFLQTLKLPGGNRLVPSVNELQRGFKPPHWSIINGWRTDFHPSHDFVVLPDDPQFSHYGLLKGFLNYYTNFPFGKNIVCPFLGQPLPRSVLCGNTNEPVPPEPKLGPWYQNWVKSLSGKVGSQHDICIQDPFQHDFVLGASCSNNKFNRLLSCMKAAVQVCQAEEELADPNASTFLTNLFTIKIKDFELKISMTLTYVPGVPEQDLLEEVFRTLEETFTKILKFEITCEPERTSRPPGEPDTKVPKKIKTQDVHQQNDSMEIEKIYNCISMQPVWRHRRKLRKDVKLAFPETAFEFETKLSDVILSHNEPSERIEFSCSVVARKPESSLEVVLEQAEGQVGKKFIKELAIFLNANLPAWVNTFLYEKLTQLSTSGVQSGQCSSIADHDVGENEESENADIKGTHSQSESETPCEDSNSSLETADQTQLDSDRILEES